VAVILVVLSLDSSCLCTMFSHGFSFESLFLCNFWLPLLLMQRNAVFYWLFLKHVQLINIIFAAVGCLFYRMVVPRSLWHVMAVPRPWRGYC
jgi:hypothetical protein